MDCTFIKLYLEEYERGQLDAEIEKEIKNHLGFCKECSQELKEIATINAIFDSIETPDLPKDFTANVMEKVKLAKEKLPDKNIWQDLGRWGASFVAAGLITLIINFSSLDIGGITLTITERSPDIIANKIYQYSPSNILNKSIEHLEDFIENFETRR